MGLELFFCDFTVPGPLLALILAARGIDYKFFVELDDNNLAAFYLRYVHVLRVCSYLARSSCGILTRLLYVVCTYLYIRFCPAGISEGFLLALRIHVCAYILRVFPAELAV